jgi:hypothetical protein
MIWEKHIPSFVSQRLFHDRQRAAQSIDLLVIQSIIKSERMQYFSIADNIDNITGPERWSAAAKWTIVPTPPQTMLPFPEHRRAAAQNNKLNESVEQFSKSKQKCQTCSAVARCVLSSNSELSAAAIAVSNRWSLSVA